MRGSAQTSLQMVQLLGLFCSTFLSAFAFNGKLYTGTFDQAHQLDFQGYVWLLLWPTTFALYACCFKVRDRGPETGAKDLESVTSTGGSLSFQGQLFGAWGLLSTKFFFSVAMYIFWNGAMQLTTPALAYVSLQWAGVHMMQSSLVRLVGVVMSALGMWLARTYLLNVSWRKICIAAVLSALILDALPQYLTIFGVIRNQYFYLGEPLTANILYSACTFVSILLGNEVADEGNAGLVLGLTTSLELVAGQLAQVLSVQVFGGLFGPNLSIRRSYVLDSQAERQRVALSVLLSYGFCLATLLLLPLLPQHKADARKRKTEWGGHRVYAYVTAALLTSTLVYCLLVDLLSLSPGLSCLRFVGGGGC